MSETANDEPICTECKIRQGKPMLDPYALEILDEAISVVLCDRCYQLCSYEI